MTLLSVTRKALLIDLRKYENRGRLHFISNLKDGGIRGPPHSLCNNCKMPARATSTKTSIETHIAASIIAQVARKKEGKVYFISYIAKASSKDNTYAKSTIHDSG